MSAEPSIASFLHIRALKAVVEHGSFSGAAKELGYTTSAISQQISQLEKTLGVNLFERGPRSVALTAAGEQMYDLGTGLLSSIAEIADKMSVHSSGKAGRLRVTAVGSAAAQLMPRAVANIAAQNPQAQISVVSPGLHADVGQAVRTGEADIGVVYEYTGGQLPQRNAGLERTPLLSEEMVILGRDQGPSGLRESIRMFRNEPWASGSTGSIQDLVLNSVCQSADFIPEVYHRSDDLDVIRGFVNQGLGIALVPVLALGIDRNIRLYRLNEVAARRQVLLVNRTTDSNPLVDVAIAAFRNAAEDFLDWSLTAFGVTFETPMLNVSPELQQS